MTRGSAGNGERECLQSGPCVGPLWFLGESVTVGHKSQSNNGPNGGHAVVNRHDARSRESLDAHARQRLIGGPLSWVTSRGPPS
eukprot:355912-Chlamydomonas_euryale.AAC.8